MVIHMVPVDHNMEVQALDRKFWTMRFKNHDYHLLGDLGHIPLPIQQLPASLHRVTLSIKSANVEESYVVKCYANVRCHYLAYFTVNCQKSDLKPFINTSYFHNI